MTLIDAEKLIRAILDFPDCENGYSDAYDKEYIISEIEAQPTVNAVPVVHGRWIVYNYPACECVYCSECKEQYDQTDLYIGGNEYPNYCPNCGARMDGES